MVTELGQKLLRAKQLALDFLGLSSSAATTQQGAPVDPSEAPEADGPASNAAMDKAEKKDGDAGTRLSESGESGASSGLKRASPHDDEDQGGEWQTVSRPRKKPKKVPRPGKGYPALTFSPNARLQAKINLNQLRDLILYIFADGSGPQWISVAHRPQFRKIVVIMVPGLEEAMFKEGVDFATYNNAASDATPQLLTAPDDIYPRALSKERLPEALQPFADMFPHLWPVKTPGDDKHAKMHSPVAAMLTAPVPKEKTSKQGGVKPATEPRGWRNERTRITEYLASADELEDNGFLLHPALLPQGERRDGTSSR
ncbi:hypothetical protein CDD83_2725 [Cordyceps sp. RAO-2017]|nr:hypothetical protein CDD83_2725 [Cordyceps sp. RAO-2017]